MVDQGPYRFATKGFVILQEFLDQAVVADVQRDLETCDSWKRRDSEGTPLVQRH